MGDDRLINRRGNRIDPAEALVQGFSGLKIIKPQIGRTLRYRGFETNDVIRAMPTNLIELLDLLMLEKQKTLPKPI